VSIGLTIHQHITGHFGDESFRSHGTGSDNLTGVAKRQNTKKKRNKLTEYTLQWRRSVAKYRATISQIKQSNYLRRLEILVLTSIFYTSLSSSMMWNCRVIQQQFWMKKR